MIRELVIQRVLVHVSGFYVWVACTLCVVMVASSLAVRLTQGGAVYSQQSLDMGKRVVYHIAGGEVDGIPRHTKREEQAVTPPKGSGTVEGETFAGHEGLAAAPLDAITEQTDKGLVPNKGHDGTVAWQYYARPYTPVESRPVVAILITNLGLSKPLTEEALKLPHNVTLSFSPYASDAKVWAKKARGEGFESLVDLPMEPSNFPISDPGPNGILSSLDGAEISSRLHWIMSRYPGFVGLLGTADEKLTASLPAMRPLLTELTARGVVLIYKKSPQNAELATLIKTQNLTAVGADMVIDEDLAPAAIMQQLDALAELAKTQGYAIGIAHSYPPTVRAITMWNEDLAKKGVDIAPVSAVVKKVYP